MKRLPKYNKSDIISLIIPLDYQWSGLSMYCFIDIFMNYVTCVYRGNSFAVPVYNDVLGQLQPAL